MTRTTRFVSVFALAAAAASVARAGDRDGFSMAVLVDGRAAPEYAARGRIYIEALKGKDFVIRLSNPTGERVAVALSVDGRNVVDAKRTTELAATKWILGPWQTADIPGWQVSGQTSRKFLFTDTAGSYAKWLGDNSNVGTIEAVFFREKRRPPVTVYKDREEQPQDSAAQSAPGAAGTAEAPRAEAREGARRQSSDKLAATGIGDETRFPVSWVEFEEDPAPVARIALRYEFRSELVRLGVLPREDDLYARDRARGFEPSYAPDPYRRQR
jgi:hypothetical protein